MRRQLRIGLGLQSLLEGPRSLSSEALPVALLVRLRRGRDLRRVSRHFRVYFRSDRLSVLALEAERREIRRLLGSSGTGILFADADPLFVACPNPVRSRQVRPKDRAIVDRYRVGRMAELDGAGVLIALADTGSTKHALLPAIEARSACEVDDDPVDRSHGHGPFILGQLVGKNGHGWVPAARVLSIKIFDADGFTSRSRILRACQIALDAKCDVFNASYGGPEPDPFTELGYDALRNEGVILVAAAGNDPREASWPASYPSVISVGAVTREGRLAEFSSPGAEVLAEGVDIVSVRARGTAMGSPLDETLTVASGTSFSAPIITALCAKVIQHAERRVALDALRPRLRGSCVPVRH